MRRRFSLLHALLIICLALIAETAVVQAHDAEILRSEPANGAQLDTPPEQVVAWFAEELVSGESTLVVYDSQGQQVDNGDGGVDLNDPDHASMLVTLPPLSDGVYTVQWHVVLLDGDATDGAFAFTVGDSPAGTTASAPAAPAQEDNGISLGIMAGAGILLALLIAGGAVWQWQRRSG